MGGRRPAGSRRAGTGRRDRPAQEQPRARALPRGPRGSAGSRDGSVADLPQRFASASIRGLGSRPVLGIKRPRWARVSMVTAVVALVVGVSRRSRARPLGRRGAAERRLARVRAHGRQEPLLAADPDHAGERRPARARLHDRLPAASTRTSKRPAVVSARDRRARSTSRRTTPTSSRSTARPGRILWQRKPREQRRLQELRHRREPRPRVLRRQALHPPARHEARRDEPERRRRSSARSRSRRTCRTRPPNYGYSETSAPDLRERHSSSSAPPARSAATAAS